MIDVAEKYYTCKYDRPFKEIFLKEKNKDMLKELLELILDKKINNITLAPTEQNQGNLNIRRKTYDALIETDNEVIEIEVNSGVYKELYPRNMAYICNLYINQTEVSNEYSEDTMIMQINLTYGLSKNHEPIRVYKVSDNNGNIFVKNFQIIELNMDYYHDLWYDKNINKELIEKNKMLIMLNLEKDELTEFSKKYKGVKRYMEDLDRLNKLATFKNFISYEEDQRKIYNSRMREAKEEGLKQGIKEGKEEGLKQGIEQGIEQGIGQRNIEIAKNLISLNINIDDISKATGLSQSEIERLIKEQT